MNIIQYYVRVNELLYPFLANLLRVIPSNVLGGFVLGRSPRLPITWTVSKAPNPDPLTPLSTHFVGRTHLRVHSRVTSVLVARITKFRKYEFGTGEDGAGRAGKARGDGCSRRHRREEPRGPRAPRPRSFTYCNLASKRIY